MQTRLLGLMLLTGCYVPLLDQPAPQCSDLSCSPGAANRSENSHVRTLNGQPSKHISDAIPGATVDCTDELLTVVGAKRAVLGGRLVLEAAVSGTTDGDEAAMPTLLWKSEDMEVTAVGPASAEVSCDAQGIHTVSVELAPPAPCPATLRVEVECVEKK